MKISIILPTNNPRYQKISVIRNGQIFGFIFGLASLFATSYLAYIHDFVTASIVGGTTIVTIVLAFIAGQKINS